MIDSLVDWFDALDTGVQWALVLGSSFGLMLLGIFGSLARPVKDESGWDAAPSELPAETPLRRPFAPKQREAK